MSSSAAARFDSRNSLSRLAPSDGVRRCEIVATVSRSTGPLLGMDRIRIDAASAPLGALARLRRRYGVPATLDLPGPGSQGVVNPLTTSELLVFASAEGFQTVSLSGVTQACTLWKARELLHPGIGLGATLRHLSAFGESLGEICDVADVIHVDFESLARSHGAERALQYAGLALVECAKRDTRCLLAKGLLPSLRTSLIPTQEEIDRVGDFAAFGGDGFVLDEETAYGAHAQESIELVRALVLCVQRPAAPSRAAARVAAGTVLPARTRSAARL